LVPGAAGKPIKLLRSKHRDDAQMSGVGTMTNICFDAFCCKCLYLECLISIPFILWSCGAVLVIYLYHVQSNLHLTNTIYLVVWSCL
jgi:hypothetical protein